MTSPVSVPAVPTAQSGEASGEGPVAPRTGRDGPRPRLAQLSRGRLIKISRYALGSLIALCTSEVVFYVAFAWLGVGTSASTVAAFVAGAVPNWLINRRWTWQRRGHLLVWREVVLYATVSGLSVVLSVAATSWANGAVRHMALSGTARSVLVTGSYLGAQVVLWGLKFAAYEFVVFADPRSQGRAGRRRTGRPGTGRRGSGQSR